MAGSENASLEEHVPEKHVPGGTVPDGTVPDGTLPDGTLPDGTLPDGNGLSADGRLHRRGARVLLVDHSQPDPRLLMVRGHDPDAPSRTFWFTPGGGIEPGETPREAAVRELAEETGYLLETHELRGPVWSRTAVFDFASQPYSQTEDIFVADLADAETRQRSDIVFTDQEVKSIDQVVWLSLGELRAGGREVFPAILLESWDTFVAWDGVWRDLGEVNE